MDFKDIIKQLGDRASKLKEQIHTEEATKTSLILPFIQALGYDIFNPMEVRPEFIADVGIKKGEKVDYAIFKDSEPKILVECKHWRQKLDLHDGQLLRYFHVTKAKFSILTNGIQYRFYTDLFEPNKMDRKPFLDFDITDIREAQIEHLKKFHKLHFDETNITNAASEMIYTNEIKLLLNNELKNPSEDFVRYFAQRAYTGRLTEKVLAWFGDLVRRSTQQVLSDILIERAKLVIDKENQSVAQQGNQPTPSEPISQGEEKSIETTELELEGFYIVKAICRQKVDSSRIIHRDALSYFSIILDDNNRKPICRLYLNGNKKFVSTFDETKKEMKHEIQSLDDIYGFSSLLLSTLENYEKGK